MRSPTLTKNSGGLFTRGEKKQLFWAWIELLKWPIWILYCLQ